jgi:hypothetical protein
VDASTSFKQQVVPFQLARQRINVLFATLRDGTFYEPRTPRLA